MSPKNSMQAIVMAAALMGAAAIGGCLSTQTSDPTGAGGGAGPSGAGGSTTPTGTGGRAPGTGVGGTTGTTGTGGTVVTTGAGGGAVTMGTGGAIVKVCATKITPMNPALIDFENYDGKVTALNYGTAFGGATANTGTAYIGPMSWGDGTATPTLSILAGHPPGVWGLSQSVTQAASWGMGGGFWMGCANASAYKGITFWVRGAVPGATFSFGVNMDTTVMPDANNPAGGGTCPGTKDTCQPAVKNGIPITADWMQVKILWAEFAPGMSGSTPVMPNGDNLAGFTWNVNIPFVPDPSQPDAAMPNYVPMASDLLFNLDDLAFLP